MADREPQAPASVKTILLVDDEEAMRRVMERRVVSWGYRVLTASSGDEALRVAKTEHPDCISIDVMMPGLDGLQTCRQLKAGSETREIPVVLVSAKAQQIDPEQVRASGALALLSKPYEPADLQQLIQKALGEKAMN